MLATLSFELVGHITSFLDARDIVRLGATSRSLRARTHKRRSQIERFHAFITTVMQRKYCTQQRLGVCTCTPNWAVFELMQKRVQHPMARLGASGVFELERLVALAPAEWSPIVHLVLLFFIDLRGGPEWQQMLACKVPLLEYMEARLPRGGALGDHMRAAWSTLTPDAQCTHFAEEFVSYVKWYDDGNADPVEHGDLAFLDRVLGPEHLAHLLMEGDPRSRQRMWRRMRFASTDEISPRVVHRMNWMLGHMPRFCAWVQQSAPLGADDVRIRTMFPLLSHE